MREFLRIFAGIFLFLTPIMTFAQIEQDFSDERKYNLEDWIGDKSHFSIYNNTLRLNQPDKSGDSYLCYPSVVADTMCWVFRLTLNFNPSSYNYARIALISPNSDLINAKTGMYILLGGRKDVVELQYKEGATYTALITEEYRLDASYSAIKVVVNKRGNEWSMSTLINGDEKPIHSDKIKFRPDIDTTNGAYLGWICHYTKSNATKFHLFSVTADYSGNTTTDPDIEDPNEDNDTIYVDSNYENIVGNTSKDLEADSAMFVSDDECLLFFNQNVKLDNAQFLLSEEGYKVESWPTQYKHIVYLSFLPPIEEDGKYTLFWHNICNLDGELLNIGSFPLFIETEGDNEDDESSLYKEPESWSDIIITEIMANPKGSVVLPEAEYIEILNTTKDTIGLNGCKLYYGDKPYELPDVGLLPGEYVILCDDDDEKLFDKSIAVVGVVSFPILVNSGKLISITNKDDHIINYVDYTDLWYRNDFAKDGGYSLELIDETKLSSKPYNWHESIASFGGTPGKKNSVEDIYIKNVDNYVKSVHQLTPNSIGVVFDKPLEPFMEPEKWFSKISESSSSYKCLNPPYATYFEIDNIGESYLVLESCVDIDGQHLLPYDTIRIWPTKQVERSDLLINELYVADRSSDEYSSFIELYNASDYAIDLSSLILELIDKDNEVKDRIAITNIPTLLNPKSYSILSQDHNVIIERYGYMGLPQIVDLAGDLDLENERQIFAIRSKKDSLIDMAVFDRSWIRQDLPEWTSLERFEQGIDGLDQLSWTEGSLTTGYASPGIKNVLDTDRISTPIDSTQTFSLVYDRLCIEGGKPESDLVIDYSLGDDINYVNIDLYTAKGLRVCNIISDEELTGRGRLVNGSKWKNDRSSIPGLYILMITSHRATGESERIKLVVPIVP